MKYERPNIDIMEVESVLLSSSEIDNTVGPKPNDIDSPNVVPNNNKSIWDEDIDYEI